MIAFIEKHLEACGVEPVAPWTWHSQAAVAHDPGKALDRSE